MGVWEGLSPAGRPLCEVPNCKERAVTAFLPAFESPGGWTGDDQQYAPQWNIAFVCEEHKPKRLKEERNEEFDPDDGRCHDCGRIRPDWRRQTNCSRCGVGLDWYCVDAHQCNMPQAAPSKED